MVSSEVIILQIEYNLNIIILFNTMKKTGLKRDVTDKFYTKPEVAKKCVEEWKRLNIPAEGSIVIEPSAGSGSFTSKLQQYNSVSFDIAPAHPDVKQQDFLQLELSTCFSLPCHYIGNPPFGRQSSTAKKFIKHICKADTTETFSFILPKSFKKTSMQRCIPLNFHLYSQIDVELNAFTVEGEDYNVPCIFQIWKKYASERYVPPKLEPIGYEFVKDKLKSRYALRRVGVNAGKIIDLFACEISGISEQSHVFITLDKPYDKFIEKYEKIEWEHDNTVGPKSIGKQEFIKEINKLF
jgi:hypothetical protein